MLLVRVVNCLTMLDKLFLSFTDVHFVNHDQYRRSRVPEDVGNIPITIISTASVDREGFLFFDHIQLLDACK